MLHPNSKIRLILALLAAIVVVYYSFQQPARNTGVGPDVERVNPGRTSGAANIETAIREQKSDYQVQGEGRVTRILADDNDGSRHQRFIIELDSAQTILIAHNIDLAPRVSGLRVGRTIKFYGEYEWNSQGGVVHWTHHDPQGRHVDGWLEYDGRRYQ